MPAVRRFPPPWTIEDNGACYIVKDRNAQALAYASTMRTRPCRSACQGGHATEDEAANWRRRHSAMSQRTPLALTFRPLKPRSACRLDGPFQCASKASGLA
jgi:hypothetical protein